MAGQFAFSKAFGPTTSTTASAEKQIGSDYLIPPGNWHIEKIRIGKSGILIEQYTGIVYLKIKGVDGTYEYAYGRGLGCATNAAALGPAEEIDCSINAPGGANCQVFVKDVVDCPGVTVSLSFFHGAGKRVDSYAVQGSVTVAATEESMGTVVMTLPGRIMQIRFVGNNNVDAEAGSAILKLTVPGLEGRDLEFAVGNGHGGDTTGYVAFTDVIDLPGGIPVGKNVTVDIRIKSTSTLMTPAASIAVA